MSKKMTTKDKLLLIIKKEGEITIKSLMEHFTISEIAIRRHLRELITQKFIEERSVKQEVGRPFIKYKLTSTGHNTFPNQDNSLPLEILQDVENILGREAVKNVLNERKKRETIHIIQKLLENHLKNKYKQFQNYKINKVIWLSIMRITMAIMILLIITVQYTI